MNKSILLSALLTVAVGCSSDCYLPKSMKPHEVIVNKPAEDKDRDVKRIFLPKEFQQALKLHHLNYPAFVFNTKRTSETYASSKDFFNSVTCIYYITPQGFLTGNLDGSVTTYNKNLDDMFYRGSSSIRIKRYQVVPEIKQANNDKYYLVMYHDRRKIN